MRLNDFQLEAIKNSFIKIFKNGQIYLFGSRVDDTKKGGDIDLYLIVEDKTTLSMKRIQFLVNLKKIMGEQKIDVVFQKDPTRAIEQEAIKNGILIFK